MLNKVTYGNKKVSKAKKPNVASVLSNLSFKMI